MTPGGPGGRLPVLILPKHYLAAVAREVRERKFRTFLFSAAFPATMLVGLWRRE